MCIIIKLTNKYVMIAIERKKTVTKLRTEPDNKINYGSFHLVTSSNACLKKRRI